METLFNSMEMFETDTVDKTTLLGVNPLFHLLGPEAMTLQ